jgi:hypothetical protein
MQEQNFIYQLIYTADMEIRSPTLETVLMIEDAIKKHSGDSRTRIWKQLPKKVMWQTYLVAVDYLQSINKIAIDKKGNLAYIWNPALARKLAKRPEIMT